MWIGHTVARSHSREPTISVPASSISINPPYWSEGAALAARQLLAASGEWSESPLIKACGAFCCRRCNVEIPSTSELFATLATLMPICCSSSQPSLTPPGRVLLCFWGFSGLRADQGKKKGGLLFLANLRGIQVKPESKLDVDWWEILYRIATSHAKLWWDCRFAEF